MKKTIHHLFIDFPIHLNSIEEIEKVIEDAEKDSVVNDIIEAAEALEVIR